MTDTRTLGEPVIDQAHFRSVLGHFSSGITILSAHDGTQPVGLTCQSFFSVSLDPPLVAFSVSRNSTSYPIIHSIGSLVINVLASDQHEISNAFAKTGTDKWHGVTWTASEIYGHPVIDAVIASLECDITTEIECGDHLLVVARVLHLQAEPARRPLLYFQGGYHHLDTALERGVTAIDNKGGPGDE